MKVMAEITSHQRRCTDADMLSDAPFGVLFERFVGLGRRSCLPTSVAPCWFFSFHALLAVRAAPVFSTRPTIATRLCRFEPSQAQLVRGKTDL